MLNHEFRPGSQHSQVSTPEFIGRCVTQLEELELKGKFAVNKLVMLCAMIAFNLLRTIGQEVIKRAHLAPVKIKVRRWRLKTVIQNIIYSPVRIIRHARTMKLRFGKFCPWFDVIKDMAEA